jgi:hypothetical protein
MNRLSISASALLRFAHLISNQFEQLGTGMFMTAIFCNISASFIGGVTGIKESTSQINFRNKVKTSFNFSPLAII